MIKSIVTLLKVLGLWPEQKKGPKVEHLDTETINKLIDLQKRKGGSNK